MMSIRLPLLLAATGWLFAAPAAAQDLEAGKRVFGQTAGCTRCHGWSGNGTPEGPGFPAGANLRTTSLDRAALREVVACGVPNSEMPHFARAAYGTLQCFGMTAAQIGNQKPPPAETFLTDAQIDAVADYLVARVVGKGPVNLAACQEYFGATSPQCARYQ
jgi:mono/diheme cytochrome c family protein